MTSNDFRTQAIEFAATYPTPAVREAIRYAEAGAITWGQVHDLFRKSLAAGVAAVA